MSPHKKEQNEQMRAEALAKINSAGIKGVRPVRLLRGHDEADRPG